MSLIPLAVRDKATLHIGQMIIFHDGQRLLPAVVVEFLGSNRYVVGVFGTAYCSDVIHLDGCRHSPAAYQEWTVVQ